jgi:hypothetical protein
LRTPWKSDLLKKMFPQRADAGGVYMAVFLPDERTLVIGDEGQIRALLKRLKAGKRAPTPPGWKEFERDLIAVAFDTRTTPCVKGDWPADATEDASNTRTLVEGVKVLAAGITIEDRTDVRFTALARDAAAAREAVTAIRQLLASARKETAAAKDDVPVQARKLIDEALDSVEITRSGQRVRMHVGVGHNVLRMLAEATSAADANTPPEPSPPRGREGWRR